MVDPLLVVIVGIPVAWHLAITGAVVYDAGRLGMSQRKWGAVALAVPLFGAFAYVFERSERSYDPAEDPYARGNTKAGFAVHESREGESLLGPADAEDADSDEDDGDDWAVSVDDLEDEG